MARLVAVHTMDITRDASGRIVSESVVMHTGEIRDRTIERDADGRVTRVTDTRRAAEDLPIMLTAADMEDSDTIYLTEADCRE